MVDVYVVVISVTVLRKKSLNSDGHQFHKYQQNKQSPITLNMKKTMTYNAENPSTGLGQTQKCCGVKSVNHINGIPTLSS